tara:strand:- start:21 stop:605 length:585 start_codon:yes stop_codon:yes gene_type:complete
MLLPTLSRRLIAQLLPLAAVPLAPHAAVGKVMGDARFSLVPPDGFVKSGRKAETGTLFVCGDFPRFAVVSVTAWPVGALLADDASVRSLPGLPAAPKLPPPSVSSLQQLGSAPETSRLLLRKRDRETSAGGLESDLLSFDDKDPEVLRLEFATPLPVSDPDELEKQRGVRQLRRRTVSKSTLGKAAGEPAVISV